MLLAMAFTGLVQAQSPVILEHRIPATTQVGWSTTGLLGGDGWRYPASVGDVGGPVAELRNGLGAEYGYNRTELWGSYSGLAEVWTDGGFLDASRAEVGLRNALGPGVFGATRGSIGQQWIESTGGLALVRPGLRFTVGPMVRSAPDLTSGGVRTDAQVLAHPGSRWSLWTGWSASVHGRSPSPTIVSARLGAQYDASFDTRVGLGVNALGSLSPTPLSTMGLPTGGSQIWRADTWLRHWFTRALAVHGELGVELGTGTAVYQRFRALVGVQLSFGLVHSPAVQAPSGQVLLRLEAADAIEVEVVGSFTGWEPLAMERRDQGWERVVDLPPGEHEYVYLVDGVPVVPPEAPSTRDDGFGGHNGVLVVEGSPM